MVLMLRAAPNATQRLLVTDFIHTNPIVPLMTYQDPLGNLCTRLQAPAGSLHITADGLLEDSGVAEPANWAARETPITALPPEALMYMLPQPLLRK